MPTDVTVRDAKVQLMWGRKRFNTGIWVFFETCPTCLVENIQKKRPEETIAQIQSLNQNVENLVANNA